ncbi:MAG: hypothetical protein HS113_29890 [Verrucomicrobiales bacterium]|nr:hypothetical protein [Verrucomicrobiales bacterium]
MAAEAFRRRRAVAQGAKPAGGFPEVPGAFEDGEHMPGPIDVVGLEGVEVEKTQNRPG